MIYYTHYSVHDFTYSNLKGPDGVVSKHLLVSNGDRERTKLLLSSFGPIQFTFDFLAFCEVSQHDNRGWPLLPYQTPEVHKSVGSGTYKQAMTCYKWRLLNIIE